MNEQKGMEREKTKEKLFEALSIYGNEEEEKDIERLKVSGADCISAFDRWLCCGYFVESMFENAGCCFEFEY